MIRVVVAAAAVVLGAGDAFALSKDAKEFVDIQAKIAPDQCTLQKLSAQAAAAARAGDQGKRQELLAQMEPVARRIQAYQAEDAGAFQVGPEHLTRFSGGNAANAGTAREVQAVGGARRRVRRNSPQSPRRR